jgi:lipid A ethanolaminephosphotransferase
MIYVSDHGESLGEDGQYLHGAPYSVAPEFQTHVPFIAWLSPQMSENGHIDTACLRSRVTEHYSHDNLFHSVLGLMDVSTVAYDPSQDIFAACRAPQQQIMVQKPVSGGSSHL